MAAIRGEMGLGMGHPDGRPHKTEGKGTCSMDELFRNIGAKKTDWNTVLRQIGGYLLISSGTDCLKFFENFRKRTFFIRRVCQVLQFVPGGSLREAVATKQSYKRNEIAAPFTPHSTQCRNSGSQ